MDQLLQLVMIPVVTGVQEEGDAGVFIHHWASVGGPGVACVATDVS